MFAFGLEGGVDRRGDGEDDAADGVDDSGRASAGSAKRRRWAMVWRRRAAARNMVGSSLRGLGVEGGARQGMRTTTSAVADSDRREGNGE